MSVKKGLAGIVVAQTELSFIDGQEGVLIYRGYPIEELAGRASFEEVAYLLWYGLLPNRSQLDQFVQQLKAEQALPEPLLEAMRRYPRSTHPMAVLRTAVSTLGMLDEEADVIDEAANRRKALRLMAKMPTIIAAWDRIRNDRDPIPPHEELGHAANYLYMLTGQVPDEAATQAVETYLILLADHGMNASTFACRVAVSTLSDIYSAVVAGIGTLKGPLHGGANERAMRMLLEIGSPERAEAYVLDLLARKERVMGMGHRVYKTQDPRARILKGLAARMSDQRWYNIALEVERVFLREMVGKRLYPNVDFYSAPVLYAAGVPIDLFTPTFAISRVVGWTAHILEQYADNRLIRPRAEYVGPRGLKWVPIEAR
ncbi:MAG: citrate synthase [Chloroflexi bacterium]|nr:MAG: citrate synthase [Chloroflexota bacterium]